MSQVKIIGKPLKNIPFEAKCAGDDRPVWRYSGNPVIGRNPTKDLARVFNSAVVAYQGAFIGIFRAEENSGRPFLRVGRSTDGIRFTIEDKRIEFTYEDGSPSRSGCQYDPRLIEMDEAYYIVWCDGLDDYPTLGMAVTHDFRTFTRLPEPVLPANRNGVLFPRKIGEEYVLLSRPSDLAHTKFGDIFMSYSRDMHYWGKHRLLLGRTPGLPWQALKIGAGPVPIETTEGWL